ncbi:MAG: Tyrosine recombinase XerC [Candidatus Ordinivivax streblomastigis]|uniref:Tyrosine recombinase XerC n=1 Tax=Candidatus Ordinivivax streblomastigis TaxID=2540710 RepID=A0A5M8P278_9BACT|nr:MAG: Tyrosine recombinase XerC [Candidatus Ordinivivax streblomastigis]
MKELVNTKVTVRIRKADDRKEWYVYVECYPVFVKGKKQPQRIREYLNRIVTTVEWDKKRTARTEADGTKTYKPKRDDNGVILCRSEKDRETMLYADGIRKLRQREYDNAELYTEDDKKCLEEKQKSEVNFIEYFAKLNDTRNATSTDGNKKNWTIALRALTRFAGESVLFCDVNEMWCESFRIFLLTAPNSGKNADAKLSNNTAAIYYSIFKMGLHQAFVDGYLREDVASRLRGIKTEETRREYLTMDELNHLAATPSKYQIVKNGALFSALTGLRHCDIQKLKWHEIQQNGDKIQLHFTQKKTKGVEYMPISVQALQFCGEQQAPDDYVFPKFPEVKQMSYYLSAWLKAANITKKITFHCFRHTFATLQLTNGTDIYTVSKMLGHSNLKYTQVYAKVVDEKKDKAAQAIKLNIK